MTKIVPIELAGTSNHRVDESARWRVIADDGEALGEVWRGDRNSSKPDWYGTPSGYKFSIIHGSRKDAVEFLERWRAGREHSVEKHGLLLHYLAPRPNGHGDAYYALKGDTLKFSVVFAYDEQTRGSSMAGWHAHSQFGGKGGSLFVSGADSKMEALELAVAEQVRLVSPPERIETRRRTMLMYGPPLARLYGSRVDLSLPIRLPNMNLLALEQMDGSYQLVPERGRPLFTLARENGETPNGNPLNGRWVLRDANGTMLGFEQYRNDLMETLGCPVQVIRYDTIKENAVKYGFDLPMMEAVYDFALNLRHGDDPYAVAGEIVRGNDLMVEDVIAVFEAEHGSINAFIEALPAEENDTGYRM
jgi:hypothetical protein